MLRLDCRRCASTAGRSRPRASVASPPRRPAAPAHGRAGRRSDRPVAIRCRGRAPSSRRGVAARGGVGRQPLRHARAGARRPRWSTRWRRRCPPARCSIAGSPKPAENPYLALLGLADRFVVTSDSVTMMVEVARLGRPLAIFELPLVRRPHAGARSLSRARPAVRSRGCSDDRGARGAVRRSPSAAPRPPPAGRAAPRRPSGSARWSTRLAGSPPVAPAQRLAI